MKQNKFSNKALDIASKHKKQNRECIHCRQVFMMTANEIKTHWENCIKDAFKNIYK